MTEFLKHERRDNLHVDESMADRAIGTILDCYESKLTNGQLKAFRDQTDVSEKVNIVCYNLAANSETRTKAVDLRSWHIVRLLVRHWNNIEPGNEWAYGIYGLSASDDFDRLVYPNAEGLLKIVAKADLNLFPQTGLSVYDEDKNVREEIILTEENKAILKREWCYSDTQKPHTAAFVVKAIESVS